MKSLKGERGFIKQSKARWNHRGRGQFHVTLKMAASLQEGSKNKRCKIQASLAAYWAVRTPHHYLYDQILVLPAVSLILLAGIALLWHTRMLPDVQDIPSSAHHQLCSALFKPDYRICR